ncbi:hypothetical protein APSETT445_005168 [Aspergillus pseudonomiae]
MSDEIAEPLGRDAGCDARLADARVEELGRAGPREGTPGEIVGYDVQGAEDEQGSSAEAFGDPDDERETADDFQGAEDPREQECEGLVCPAGPHQQREELRPEVGHCRGAGGLLREEETDP